jgi:DNA ligase (NAD+)
VRFAHRARGRRIRLALQRRLYCPAQRKQALIHFASRRAMDIEGLGDRLIDDLVELGYLNTIADIYRLQLSDFLEMRRRADERDGTVPETVKAARSPASGRKTCSRPSRRAARRRWSGCCSRSASATSASPPRARWRATSARSIRCWPRTRRSCWRSRRRPIVARRIATFFAEQHNREAIAALRAAGVRWPEGRRSVPRKGRWPARPWC